MDQVAVASAAPALIAERLTDSSALASLKRLAESGQVERGCVTVIGLDAIRERLGPKWAARRDWVWLTVDRHLQRRLGDTGFAVRLSEVDFAVCAGSDAGLSQAITLNLLRELLDFFLGTQRYEDMRLASVVWVKDDEIGCAPLDPRKIAPLEEGRSFDPTAVGAGLAAAGVSSWSVLNFVTGDGRRLQLDLAYEPVINLKNRVPVATRLKPVARDRDTGAPFPRRWVELLSPSDQTQVIEAIGEAAAETYADADVGLVVPCSLYALSTVRNRAVMAEGLQGLKARPAKPVVMELTDVEPGTPQGRLLEGVSLLTPYCRAVICRVTGPRQDAETMRAARVGGLSVDCSELDGRELIARLSNVAQFGRTIGPLLFAFGLSSAAACELAAGAGATHGGLEAPRPTIASPRTRH